MTTFTIYRDPSKYTDDDLKVQVSHILQASPRNLTIRRPSCYPDEPDEYPLWRAAMLAEYNARFSCGAKPAIERI